jgi:hypothetical protein
VTSKTQEAVIRALAASVVCLAVGLAGAPMPAGQEVKNPDEGLDRAIVQSICPDQVRIEKLKNGTSLGCGGCPSFTSFPGQEPSKGNQPDFELRKVLTGSFTRAGAKEVLAEFFGCEPHADNFGGTLILDQSGPKLKCIKWVPGTVGLVRVSPVVGGRDLVLSQGGYTGQGESTGWVSTYDFTKPDATEQTLLTIEDDSGNACMAAEVKIGYISGLEFPDLNGDGKPDLRVHLKAGKVTVPAKFRGHCELDFKPPAPATYTIDFVFTGNAFKVTPSTAATLKRVNTSQN